jgi:hypothetical protein
MTTITTAVYVLRRVLSHTLVSMLACQQSVRATFGLRAPHKPVVMNYELAYSLVCV